MGKRGTERSVIGLLVIAGMMSACGLLPGNEAAQPQPTATPRVEIPIEFIETIDSSMMDLLAAFHVPGVALGIIHEGEIVWLEGYGYADFDNRIPVTPGTIFQAGSISTTVTAWGVMNLAEDGIINLDNPIAAYVQTYPLPESPFNHGNVTPRLILGHTAGLSVQGYRGFELDEELPSLLESLNGEYEGGEPVRLYQEPGSDWRYSGGGYSLLQVMVEEVSGQSFADYMELQVLKPLGMDDTSFTRPEGGSLATGYDSELGTMTERIYVNQAAASLFTTVEDLSQFAVAYMSGPGGEQPGRDVIGAISVAEMMDPVMGSDGAFGFGSGGSAGLGIALDRMENGQLIAPQFGSNPGWKSLLAIAPEAGEGLVVLTNSDNGIEISLRLLCAWSGWAFENVPLICSSIQ